MQREAGLLSGQKGKWREASLASAGVHARRAECRAQRTPPSGGGPHSVSRVGVLLSTPHRCAHSGFSGGGGQPGPRRGLLCC